MPKNIEIDAIKLRNRNTVEFLGIWEKVHNPNFNSVEFDIIKSQSMKVCRAATANANANANA